MIAKTDTTTLFRGYVISFLIPLSIARRRTSAPAPGVEGGNDGLHGDELVMGEAVDKEDGGKPEEA